MHEPFQEFADDMMARGAVINQQAFHDAEREQTGEQGNKAVTAQFDTPTPENAMGNVPAMPAVEPVADDASTRGSPAAVMSRLKSEGRWFGELEYVRDEMIKAAKAKIRDKTARQRWVYGELDRMYPPLKNGTIVPKSSTMVESATGVQTTEKAQFAPSDDGSIQGLNTLPKAWPELPANASLQAEVAWVQANRLRIVTEQPGRATVVKLDQALSPAPSWAALGWLETSIRSYAKFVDVAAKASGSDDSESAVMKRERMSIEEMKALLAEMDQPASGI
jgi:hypothetical protein